MMGFSYQGSSETKISCEGQLLLRLEGKPKTYQPRYFVLDEAGTLLCYRKKGGAIDQCICIYSALVTFSTHAKSIHIDSDQLSWHLKCESPDLYDKWHNAVHAAVQKRSQGEEQYRNLDEYKAKVAHLLAQMQTPLSKLNQAARTQQQTQGEPSSSDLKGLKKVLKPLKLHTKTVDEPANQDDDIEEVYGHLIELHRHLTDLATQPFEGSDPDAQTLERHGQKSYYDTIKSFVGVGGSDVDKDETHDGIRIKELSIDDSNAEEGNEEQNLSDEDEDEDDRDDTRGDESREHAVAASQRDDKIKRRDKLPSPQKAAKTSSVFGLLRNSIGKDLTKISFPVSLNEPLSALQRVAEELQYCNLLTKASASDSLVQKLAYIAAYCVSPMAGTKSRTNKKPFNAMLGETYELIREDMGFRFISEKVSHHPPIHAFHAEQLDGKWSYHGASTADQKFWGRSVEVFPRTALHIKIGDDKFVLKARPSVTVRGIMSSGSNSIEYCNKLEVQHEGSPAKVILRFRDRNKNEIKGTLYDEHGKETAYLRGAWDNRVSLSTGEDTYKDLWNAEEPLKDRDRYFGMGSRFARQLNEITEVEKDKLPPTDTRLRPDQCAYEEGDTDKAEDLKNKLEERQRKRRSDWEGGGGKSSKPPQYFEKKGSDLEFELRTDYWEKRDKGDWPDFDPFSGV